MGTDDAEIRPSTTWAWKHVTIDPPPAAPPAQRPKDPSKPPLSHWDRRTPLTLQIRYRGGPEAWYEVKGRGRTWRVTGDIGIHDVMEAVYGRGVTRSRD